MYPFAQITFLPIIVEKSTKLLTKYVLDGSIFKFFCKAFGWGSLSYEYFVGVLIVIETPTTIDHNNWKQNMVGLFSKGKQNL